MAKHWTAFKRGLTEPIEAMYLKGNRAVFHKIEVTDSAIVTPDGPMAAVHIRQKIDLCDPANDIAALVGKVKIIRKSGAIDPQSPELWYWNDRFWVKAVDAAGADYYHKSKVFLFHEIEVNNPDEFLGGLVHMWNTDETD
jgi:hypothetical protein